jgi:phosphoribosyl-AMP cyclohydrolase
MTNLDFGKLNGLLPAVLQDAATGDVLMVGFMNREAFEATMQSGFATFFSRTRGELWTKGESSGNRARVVSVHTDCDRDTLLLRVQVQGSGRICHKGTSSCFTESLEINTGIAREVLR